MPRRVKGPDGIVRTFPDDATDAEIAAALEAADAPPPRQGGELGRKDVGAVSVDQNWISNQASKLPRPLQYPAAFLGSILGTVLEGASQPESIATGMLVKGAGGLPRMPVTRPNYEGAGSGLLENVNALGRTLEGTPSIPGHPGAGTAARITGRLLQKVEPGKAAGYERYSPSISNYGDEAQNVGRYAPPVPYAAPTPSAPPKLALSSSDFLKIQRLKEQGVSDEMAVKILQDLKDRGNEVYNRR